MTEIIPGYFVHTPDEKFGPYANIMEADTAAEKLMSEGVQVLGITKEGFEGVVSYEALEYSAESVPPQSPCYFQCGREADIRRKLGPHHVDIEVLVCGSCSIAYNMDPHLHSWKPFGAEYLRDAGKKTKTKKPTYADCDCGLPMDADGYPTCEECFVCQCNKAKCDTVSSYDSADCVYCQIAADCKGCDCQCAMCKKYVPVKDEDHPQGNTGDRHLFWCNRCGENLCGECFGDADGRYCEYHVGKDRAEQDGYSRYTAESGRIARLRKTYERKVKGGKRKVPYWLVSGEICPKCETPKREWHYGWYDCKACRRCNYCCDCLEESMGPEIPRVYGAESFAAEKCCVCGMAEEFGNRHYCSFPGYNKKCDKCHCEHPMDAESFGAEGWSKMKGSTIRKRLLTAAKRTDTSPDIWFSWLGLEDLFEQAGYKQIPQRGLAFHEALTSLINDGFMESSTASGEVMFRFLKWESGLDERKAAESFSAESSVRKGMMGNTEYRWYVDGDESIQDRNGEPLIRPYDEEEIDEDIQHNIKLFLEGGEKKGEAYHEVHDLHDRFDEPQYYDIFYSWGAESFSAESLKGRWKDGTTRDIYGVSVTKEPASERYEGEKPYYRATYKGISCRIFYEGSVLYRPCWVFKILSVMESSCFTNPMEAIWGFKANAELLTKSQAFWLKNKPNISKNAESKIPPAEKAGITGITSGATMEGLETLLATDTFASTDWDEESYAEGWYEEVVEGSGPEGLYVDLFLLNNPGITEATIRKRTDAEMVNGALKWWDGLSDEEMDKVFTDKKGEAKVQHWYEYSIPDYAPEWDDEEGPYADEDSNWEAESDLSCAWCKKPSAKLREVDYGGGGAVCPDCHWAYRKLGYNPHKPAHPFKQKGAEGELEETQEELAEVRTELSKSRTGMSLIRTGLAIAGFVLLWEHHKWAKEEHDIKENTV